MTLAARAALLLLLPSSVFAESNDQIAGRLRQALEAAQGACRGFGFKDAASAIADDAECGIKGTNVLCGNRIASPGPVLKKIDALIKNEADASKYLGDQCPWQLFADRGRALQARLDAKRLDPKDKQAAVDMIAQSVAPRALSGFYSTPDRSAKSLKDDYSKLIVSAENLGAEAIANASTPAALLKYAVADALKKLDASKVSAALKPDFQSGIISCKSADEVGRYSQIMDEVANTFGGQSPVDYYKAKLAAQSAAIKALGDDAFRVQWALGELNKALATPLDLRDTPWRDQVWATFAQALAQAQTAAKNTASLKAAYQQDVASVRASINALTSIGDPDRARLLENIDTMSHTADDCKGRCGTEWQDWITTTGKKDLAGAVGNAKWTDGLFAKCKNNAAIIADNVRASASLTADQKASLGQLVANFQAQTKGWQVTQLMPAYIDLRSAMQKNGVSAPAVPQ
jgi:hypothetical protein